MDPKVTPDKRGLQVKRMQLSQWELLQGTCVNLLAKSILNSLMATDDKKSYDERKSVRQHLQSEVFLRKMLQIQRRK